MGVVTVDFDGTLYQGNSFKLMFQTANKEFGLKQWAVVATGIVKAAAIGMLKGKNAFRLEFFKAFAKSFKGKTSSELDDFFQKLVALGKQDAHHDLIHKIREHERQGNKIIVLSGALHPFLKLLQRIGARCACDQYGIAVQPKGKCTGKVGPIINGNEKVKKVQEWMKYEKQTGKLTDEEATEVWAYADSESDIPLFQFVTYPIVVNPDQGMKEIAEKYNWPLFV